MKDRFKKIAALLKEEVKTHRGKIVFLTCTAVYLSLTISNTNRFYAFLEEHGIDPIKFYNPEYYDELNS